MRIPQEAMRFPCVELGPDLAETSKDLRTTAVAGVYDPKVSLSLHCGRLLGLPGSVLSSDLGAAIGKLIMESTRICHKSLLFHLAPHQHPSILPSDHYPCNKIVPKPIRRVLKHTVLSLIKCACPPSLLCAFLDFCR